MEVASILETAAEFNQTVIDEIDESISKPLLCPLGKAHLSEGGVHFDMTSCLVFIIFTHL